MQLLGQSITRNSALLALFALFTALLIAGTWLATRDSIALEQR
ncbi:MAG: electron transporter RnfG, partial [Haliea sp.]|nr:electron transporter RnfG [Haliea sp.]